MAEQSPLERAARALCYADRDYQFCAMNCAKQGQCVGDIGEVEKEQVRAMLMAIREPSEGMIAAAEAREHEQAGGPISYEDCWQALIDSALEE